MLLKPIDRAARAVKETEDRLSKHELIRNTSLAKQNWHEVWKQLQKDYYNSKIVLFSEQVKQIEATRENFIFQFNKKYEVKTK